MRANGGPRHTYIFECSEASCNNLVRVRSDALKIQSGKCKTHSHVKRPFESIYQGLFRDWRGIKVRLTYEEFLKFTEIRCCHYCDEPIPWEPYGTVNGEYKSRAYFLDRKDTDGPYSADNCVVCCTRCNRFRSAFLTYDEMLVVSKALKQYRLSKTIVGSKHE